MTTVNSFDALPRFFLLLKEAEQASTACDDHDLRSDDPVSVKCWEELKAAQLQTCYALIEFVLRHGRDVQLSLTGDYVDMVIARGSKT